MRKLTLLALASLFIAGLFYTPVMATEEELSLTATASSVYSTSTAYQTANAVDGNYNNYWLSARDSFPCWIAFDAGEAKEIGHVSIRWYSQTYAPTDYDIEISDDGQTWEAIETGLSAVYNVNGESKDINRQARYIRLYINNARYYGVVREFEAYTRLNLPRTIRFQGSLGDPNGIPLDGTFTLTFRLYDTETGGSLLWQEAQIKTVEAGLLDVELGSVTPIELSFDKQYWLGVEVESDGEMTPRFKLTAVPYAIRSEE